MKVGLPFDKNKTVEVKAPKSNLIGALEPSFLSLLIALNKELMKNRKAKILILPQGILTLPILEKG